MIEEIFRLSWLAVVALLLFTYIIRDYREGK